VRTQLSVVIACRDAAATIGEQLGALARQRVDGLRWDVLVCDNGSTDGSQAIVDSYRGSLPVRVVPAAGRTGPAHARNVGAAASDAEWLAFVDADDVVADGWLAAVVAGMQAHPFIAGRFEAARLNDSRTAATRVVQQQRGLQGRPGQALPHAGAGNMAIHRAVFECVGGFDESLTHLEDTDFCWRVQLAGCPLVFWPDAVLHLRLRSTWRGRWAQAFGYGAATADLERRYARIDPGRAAVGSSAPAVEEARRPSVQSLTWQLGWHVGHRRRRAARPGRPPTAAPAPADARRTS
jgi:glycosyltransferase involved in cell wall biosynthesis